MIVVLFVQQILAILAALAFLYAAFQDAGVIDKDAMTQAPLVLSNDFPCKMAESYQKGVTVAALPKGQTFGSAYVKQNCFVSFCLEHFRKFVSYNDRSFKGIRFCCEHQKITGCAQLVRLHAPFDQSIVRYLIRDISDFNGHHLLYIYFRPVVFASLDLTITALGLETASVCEQILFI